MERRNNNDDDRTPPKPTNPNIFDDEYALDPDEDTFNPFGIADGYRPPNVVAEARKEERRPAERNHDESPTPRPSLSGSYRSEPNVRRVTSRSSTAKPSYIREAAWSDGRSGGNHTRAISSQTTAQHRASVSSTGSFVTMATSEGPLETGPSHPYGMYPQNTVARSASVTTSSAGRQPHRSSSVQRPMHPYGMYRQNVVESPDEPSPAPAPSPAPVPAPVAIPVGFPGLSTGYHRQIGPDGEEQDIIGPDGHTEQLPPYTRYPEEGHTKTAMAAEGSATPVVTPVPAPPVIPLPIDSPPVEVPPPASQERSRAADDNIRDASPDSSNSEEQGLSEKIEPKPTGWKRWSNKKLWGKVPLGLIILLFVLVIVFAIILGAAIGTVVGKAKKAEGKHYPKPPYDDPSEPQVSRTTNTMFDASPYPTPPSMLPELPVGAFALPLGTPQESSSNCLPVANQLPAWSCKLSMIPLLLTVNTTFHKGDALAMRVASIDPFIKPDGGIQYGVQPPSLGMNILQLVLDQDFRQYGAAWHFQKTYDKVVVLDPDEFAAGAGLRARQPNWEPERNGDPWGNGGNGPQSTGVPTSKTKYGHRIQVQPGDTPWFCVWNQTFIEGYIYVQNSSAASFTAFPTGGFPGGPPPFLPPQTAASDGSKSTAAPSVTGGPPEAQSTALSRRGDGDYPRLAPYPRIVKIEERRLPGSDRPYCKKMQFTTDGKLVPVLDINQQPVKIILEEDNPTMEEFFLSSDGASSSQGPTPTPTPTTPATRRQLEKRRDPTDACHCQWMFM
ncbi:hypothetical protein GQ43DRAFT_384796 [Delitschia confertaspora ATCC 74209]|uniref:DUF7820 domain-containing protein n=1 Tax=Delitschia confertaspora ATCC 74209 TaxID=1513339 RepID=A0A9P4MXD3_9PLEO|nr:hypothetical protein GQ43DRAFT_384796 [Delitschia confertaspora ATCC 74209]